MPTLQVGDIAPEFTLKDHMGNDVTLSSFRGKKQVVLAFYVFAFTGGCRREMTAYQQNSSALEAAETQVLGVSMDSPFANKAFAESMGVTFPLLSDWGGDVTRAYGIYNEKEKAPRRVTYLIDKAGKVTSMQVDKDAVDPTTIVTECTIGAPKK